MDIKKTFLKLSPLVLLFFFLPLLAVQADGVIIPHHSAKDKDIYEPSQTGLIVYDQGREDIYLKANYEGKTNNFAWVVPTPNYPEVEEAPKDIFKELSIYTTPDNFSSPQADAGSLDSSQEQKTNVIVHEQKKVGIYEISVLSARGKDGLYNWLKKNNYPVTEEAKSILDRYIDKEWYFTAMRIAPEKELQKIIKDFNQEVEEEITKDNLASMLANYYKGALDDSDLEQVKISFEYFSRLAPSDHAIHQTAEEIKDMSPEEFETESESLSSSDLIKAKEDIYSWIQEMEKKEEVDKYDDYIEPVKISFQSNSIVYPLKISQISTRVPQDPEESPHTNEVLLYVLAQEQVKAPGFELEYNEKVDKNKIEAKQESMYSKDLNSLKEIIKDKEYFLTKMRRTFAKKEMDEDLYIIPGKEYLSKTKIIPLSQSYKKGSEYQKAKERVQGSALSDRLKGEIVIKTQDEGKAYYINSTTGYSHFLGRPADAFGVMRDQGVGIQTSDLSRIPVSLKHLNGPDSDGDGLPDKFEKAIGTDIHNVDTDNDGYNDKEELKENNDPIQGSGAELNIDKDFAEKQEGKILLQVENNGEAWYVNPADGKRYFLGQPADSFEVMRNLGLGVSNSDFQKLR